MVLVIEWLRHNTLTKQLKDERDYFGSQFGGKVTAAEGKAWLQSRGLAGPIGSIVKKQQEVRPTIKPQGCHSVTHPSNQSPLAKSSTIITVPLSGNQEFTGSNIWAYGFSFILKSQLCNWNRFLSNCLSFRKSTPFWGLEDSVHSWVELNVLQERFGCGFSVFPNGYCPESLVLSVRLLRQGLVGSL